MAEGLEPGEPADEPAVEGQDRVEPGQDTLVGVEARVVGSEDSRRVDALVGVAEEGRRVSRRGRRATPDCRIGPRAECRWPPPGGSSGTSLCRARPGPEHRVRPGCSARRNGPPRPRAGPGAACARAGARPTRGSPTGTGRASPGGRSQLHSCSPPIGRPPCPGAPRALLRSTSTPERLQAVTGAIGRHGAGGAALRVVMVGGVAGGMSAATRLRRLDEEAQIIVLERSGHVSYANCGLPYFVGGVIEDEDDLLLQTPRAPLRAVPPRRAGGHRGGRPSTAPAHTVTVRSTLDGRRRTLPYDKLVLSPGAAPVRPPIPGFERVRVAADGRGRRAAGRATSTGAPRDGRGRSAPGSSAWRRPRTWPSTGIAVTMVEAAAAGAHARSTPSSPSWSAAELVAHGVAVVDRRRRSTEVDRTAASMLADGRAIAGRPRGRRHRGAARRPPRRDGGTGARPQRRHRGRRRPGGPATRTSTPSATPWRRTTRSAAVARSSRWPTSPTVRAGAWPTTSPASRRARPVARHGHRQGLRARPPP